MQTDPALHDDLKRARQAASANLLDGLGPYRQLVDTLQARIGRHFNWVRDVTVSNSTWGNRQLQLFSPSAGVHALGGGIGQGLAMGIGAAIAATEHDSARKTIALAGDGGFILNLGELATAVQEQANMLIILMNDQGYGVIKNIQDDIYGSRHCYVELHTPEFAHFCASLQARHFLLDSPARTAEVLGQALAAKGPVVVEVDMKAWGPFAAKFAGPILKKEPA